ncbi:NfeD family protein [Aquiflexum gelatinilyticum]|uniref:Nodulation protein NfeD n=1 Tax=Aquiflexum gelatinilyticum TaxID=2961943 RepID=A0A9X2T3A6_9BACT|nr:NfeD family protein [Aquiflexum gelatinilyticum]MCR9017451.1 nodulation protein NfeD [Aquiflexum gelatinilyticum]
MVWFILSTLLLIGLILVIAEILFVPGTTVVGIIGVLVTAVGIYYAFVTFDRQVASMVLVASLVLNFGALIYGFRTGAWKKFALKSAIKSRAFDDRLKGLEVGMKGITISDVKPIGKAEIGEGIYEVKSESGFISVGTSVFITKLENNTIIIK